MGNFFAELKRRHIYRVAAAYAVVAWVLLQLVNNIAPASEAADLGGDIGPGASRHRLSNRADLRLDSGSRFRTVRSRKAAPRPSTGFSRAAAIAVIALIPTISMSVHQRRWSTSGATSIDVRPQPRPWHLHRGAALRQSVGRCESGILLRRHDRGDHRPRSPRCRTCTWSRAPRLSSSRARSNDLRTIGQALGATHLIEGSVRKAGNRVRITAQLIRPTTARISGRRITTASLPTSLPSRKTSRRPSPPPCACRWDCSRVTIWCAAVPRTRRHTKIISARER